MRQGIIKISLEVLAGALLLPKNYKPLGLYYDPEARVCSLIVESEALPEVEEHAMLPVLQVSHTFRNFPISAEIRAPK